MSVFRHNYEAEEYIIFFNLKRENHLNLLFKHHLREWLSWDIKQPVSPAPPPTVIMTHLEISGDF